MSMKAYYASADYLDYATIVFAETRGKAKALALHTDAFEDSEYTDVRVSRRPALDRYYRGLPEMDWENTDDRIAMVRDAGFVCSWEYDIDECECKMCPASEWCARYEEMKDEEQYNG